MMKIKRGKREKTKKCVCRICPKKKKKKKSTLPKFRNV